MKWNPPGGPHVVFPPQLCCGRPVWPWPSYLTSLSLFPMERTSPNHPPNSPSKGTVETPDTKLNHTPDPSKPFKPVNSFTELQFTCHKVLSLSVYKSVMWGNLQSCTTITTTKDISRTMLSG